MKKTHFLLSLMILWSSLAASQTKVSFDFENKINSNYIGNGVQWDPYQLDYGHGQM